MSDWKKLTDEENLLETLSSMFSIEEKSPPSKKVDKILKKVEELLEIEKDFMAEQDYKVKYENLCEFLSGVSSTLERTSNEIINSINE